MNLPPCSYYTTISQQLYNLSRSNIAQQMQKKEGITLISGISIVEDPGSFHHASLLGKMARLAVTILLIIVTLGFILLFFSIENLLDLNIRSECSNKNSTPQVIQEPVTLPPYDILNKNIFPEKLLTLFELPSSIPRDSWDNYTIVDHCQKLHIRYPQFLIQGPQPIASCFSLERLLFLDLHLYDPIKEIFLDHPDMSVCEHQSYGHSYLGTTPCNSLRIFAYPLWHHPLATTEEEITQKMLAISDSNCAGLSHWCLVIVNLDLREVVYFDSLASFIDPQLIDPKLDSIAKRLGELFPISPHSHEPFSIKKVVDVPIQDDSFSCGIWITIFLEKYLENPQNIPKVLNHLTKHRYRILRDFLTNISEITS